MVSVLFCFSCVLKYTGVGLQFLTDFFKIYLRDLIANCIILLVLYPYMPFIITFLFLLTCPIVLIHCLVFNIHTYLLRAYVVLLSRPFPFSPNLVPVCLSAFNTFPPLLSAFLPPLKILQDFTDWTNLIWTRCFTCLPPLSLEEMNLLSLSGKSSVV